MPQKIAAESIALACGNNTITSSATAEALLNAINFADGKYQQHQNELMLAIKESKIIYFYTLDSIQLTSGRLAH